MLSVKSFHRRFFVHVQGTLLKLLRLRPQVVPVPATHMHDRLEAEWRNATAWPKHLLVEYRWRERHEVNAVPGLYLIFTTCTPPKHLLS